MKRGSTHFLRFVIILAGAVVLALCVFALPALWKGGSEEYPTASQALFLIVAGLYVAAVPFFVALWQTLKLLSYIDQGKAFSDLSVHALRDIKRCAIAVSAVCIGIVPLLVPIAHADDAPGLVLFGMVFALAPIAVGVFAATLQKLLQNAIDIKSENDLTV